jgi:hypothetical protein
MTGAMAGLIRGLDRLPLLAPLAWPADPSQLLDHEGLLPRLRLAIREALERTHLVDVAAELSTARGYDLPLLEALGVPTDLLRCFPKWREGLRTPFLPTPTGDRLAPAGASVPLGTLRLQLSPSAGTIPYALTLLRHLLGALDPATRFVVVVEPGANLEALGQLADRFLAGARPRVRFVAMRTITVFAQDNARAARGARGEPALLVPRGFRAADLRAEDEIDPAEAERAFGVPVRRSRLYWEGGNVVHDEERCFIGVDTIAENVARLGLTADEVAGLFEAEFGLPVTLLGRLAAARFDARDERIATSGQASFHVDLDVAMLGLVGRARRPRALVADAARGLDFADDVLATRRMVEKHFLPAEAIRRHVRAEYEAYAAERHPRLLEYAETLTGAGRRIIGVPDLRLDPAMDVFKRVNFDFGYCNVLPGLRHGRPAVHYFRSGIRALDADAAARIGLAGVQAVPVSTPDIASALMLLQGGLHCCCGSL